jgi:peptidyl-tRNA hydrolase
MTTTRLTDTQRACLRAASTRTGVWPEAWRADRQGWPKVTLRSLERRGLVRYVSNAAHHVLPYYAITDAGRAAVEDETR